MLKLKAFLDGLAGENHPFRKGPGLADEPASGMDVLRDPAKVPADGADSTGDEQARFYFSRLNKN